MAGNFDYNITKEGFRERYTPLKMLAKTGMSKVGVFKDQKFGKDIVIKFLFPKFEEGISPAEYHEQFTEFKKRFDREIEIARQLDHPNVVRLFEYGQYNNITSYLSMEYVKGRDMRDAIQYVKEKKLFSLEEFLLMFDQICEPLEWAHKKGLVHRDLKPMNILLGDKGQIAICDWGIAKIIDGDDAGSPGSTSRINLQNNFVTAAGIVIGTPSYITPEQIRAEPVTNKTDIYQIAAVLYEVITGDPPFSMEREEFRRRQETEDHSFDLERIYVPELKKIIKHAMEPEQEDRYESLGEFRQDIRKFLHKLYNSNSKTRFLRRAEEKPVLYLSDIVKKWAKIEK